MVSKKVTLFFWHFILGCGGYFTSFSGNITSPGFPNNYPNNANCIYEIRVPINRRIVLDLLFHDFEDKRDMLKIRQTVSGSSIFVADLTGTRNYDLRFTSHKNRFTLMFTSDASITKRGFSARYHSFELGR